MFGLHAERILSVVQLYHELIHRDGELVPGCVGLCELVDVVCEVYEDGLMSKVLLGPLDKLLLGRILWEVLNYYCVLLRGDNAALQESNVLMSLVLDVQNNHQDHE